MGFDKNKYKLLSSLVLEGLSVQHGMMSLGFKNTNSFYENATLLQKKEIKVFSILTYIAPSSKAKLYNHYITSNLNELFYNPILID